MARKRKIKREEILIAVSALLGIMLIASGSITITGAAAVQKDFQIPDEQCYSFAENRDNMIKNRVEGECTLIDKFNPCTNTNMNAVKYCTKDWHTWRVVFENGDIKGRTGFGTYPYGYAICTNGKAKVNTVNLAIVHWKGIGWGIWANHPNANYGNQWSIQKCDTIN